MPKTRSRKATTSKSLCDHEFFKSKESKIDDEQFNALPVAVRYRVEALRKLQISIKDSDLAFENELLHLANKYHMNLKDVYAKRSKIINGFYEPSSSELLNTVKGVKSGYKPSNNISGVPYFWYTVLERNILSNCWLEEEDTDCLKTYLNNITLTYHNSENIDEVFDYSEAGDIVNTPYEGDNELPVTGQKDGEGDQEVQSLQTKSKSKKSSTTKLNEIDMFKINFEFSPNTYFHNKILSKSYYMRRQPQKSESPFNFDRTDIYKSKGTKIEWKNPTKNLTQTLITKKQKNKATGAVRNVKKVEKNDSFFNFFNENDKMFIDDDEIRNKPENKDLEEDEIEALIEEAENEVQIDFDLGNEFKDNIIPNAIIIFTNELDDDEDSSDDEDSDSDDSDASSGSESGSSESGSSDSDSESGTCSDSADDSDDGGNSKPVDKPECKQQ